MLTSATSQPFDAYSRYYDLLYQDKDYAGEADYVRLLLQRYGPSDNSPLTSSNSPLAFSHPQLLELGCGTGKHAVLFAEAGYQVNGIELSDTMLARAQERAAASSGMFEVHQGDARTFSVDEQFDAVISLFHVVSYQTSNQDVQQMLANAARHLRPGGVFLFDVWYGPAVLTVQPSTRLKRMENDELQVVRIGEPDLDVNSNTVTVKYTVFITDKVTGSVTQLSESHPMRYYFTPELELLATTNGLEIIHSEEWLTGAPPSDQTWGVCFIVRKMREASD